MKPTSADSLRKRLARLSEGEGEAKRKAGLMECKESLLLLLLNGGQGVTTGPWASCREQPVEGEVSVEGPVMLDASRPRGDVFGVPGGHRPGNSEEWTILSSTSLVL